MKKFTFLFVVLMATTLLTTQFSFSQSAEATTIEDLLNRLETFGRSTLSEPVDLFNDTERAMLQEYFSTTIPTGNSNRAPGDVYVLNLRSACGNEYGIVPLGGPYTIAPITVNTNSYFSGDLAGATGTLYAMDNNLLTLVSIDKDTGLETPVGPLTNLIAGQNTRGLGWNDANSTMYALGGDGDDVTVYTVNLGTGELTVVGTTTIAGLIGIWLVIDNDGNAYMADLSSDALYSMDLTTGLATLIGPLGIDINFAQDADFDPDSGVLYMAAYIGGGVNLFGTVDTATGTFTSLGTINADCAEVGIVGIEGTELGVDDNLLSEVFVYPNPITNVLNIRVPSNIEIQSIALYDVLGKDTGARLVNGAVNTASLAKGVYLLTVNTSAGTLTKKVIKN